MWLSEPICVSEVYNYLLNYLTECKYFTLSKLRWIARNKLKVKIHSHYFDNFIGTLIDLDLVEYFSNKTFKIVNKTALKTLKFSKNYTYHNIEGELSYTI